MRRLLVTGGLGFIGSNFIHYMLHRHADLSITNLDCMTYAGNPANVREWAASPRYRWERADLADAAEVGRIVAEGYDAVVHFAAESHVDRSIREPDVFVRTNVLGTQHLLEAVKRHGAGRFIHVSTDEVYGSLGAAGAFREDTPLAPNSPYSASKAASDLLARAYHKTYGLPVVITRCSNNYGPRQFPEKLIPTIILRALRDREIPIYGDGSHVRDWLHVADHCRAIEAALDRGGAGEVYNVGGHNERTNLQVACAVLEYLGKPKGLIRSAPDRLGHDRRYAIDPGKIAAELGWAPRIRFEEGLADTIEWYLRNRRWWEAILDGSYRKGDGR